MVILYTFVITIDFIRKVINTSGCTGFPIILYFIIGNKCCHLFISLYLTSRLPFFGRKYQSKAQVQIRQLSVSHSFNYNGEKKQLVQLTTQLLECFVAEVLCSRTYPVFPISSHRVLKRCVHKGQDLMKVILFTVSSRTSETVLFFTAGVWQREYSCYCSLVLLERKNFSCTLLDSVLECLQIKLANRLAKDKTDFYSNKDTLEFTGKCNSRRWNLDEIKIWVSYAPFLWERERRALKGKQLTS